MTKRSPLRAALLTAPAAIAMTLVGCDRPVHSESTNRIALAGPSSTLTLTGRVVDEAKLLSPAQQAALTAKLATLERNTKHQMVVVTVNSLGNQDILLFTVDLGRRWGIGRKAFNDGVILLVAPNERRARIEVGYGLEKTLPDEFCAKIMNTIIIPRFRAGDMAGGIADGTDALIAKMQNHVGAARSRPRVSDRQ